MSTDGGGASDHEDSVKRGPQEGDPVSDWRVINKKAESDQQLWEEDMKRRRAQGLPEMPIEDWLNLQDPNRLNRPAPPRQNPAGG